jgi:hypothetical protein
MPHTGRLSFKHHYPLSFLVERSETENPANHATARLRNHKWTGGDAARNHARVGALRRLAGLVLSRWPCGHAMDPRYTASPFRKDDKETESLNSNAGCYKTA